MIYVLQIYRSRVNIYWNFKSKETNVIAGCIYHYPHIDLLNKVIEYYTNNLFDKLSEENKTVFVLGDLNKDLLKYDQH